jgi:hypothetical protein
LDEQGPELIKHDEEVGFDLIMADDIDDLGTDDIIKHIRQRIGDSPVYLRYVSRKYTASLIVIFIAPVSALILTPSVCSQLIIKHGILISFW